jgi:translation elongation factor IF5A
MLVFSYVVLKGRPCKITEINFSKEHGGDKIHLVALDVFTGKRLEDLCPPTKDMDFPTVSRTDYRFLYTEDGYLNLMGPNNTEKADVKVPDGDIGRMIGEYEEAGDGIGEVSYVSPEKPSLTVCSNHRHFGYGGGGCHLRQASFWMMKMMNHVIRGPANLPKDLTCLSTLLCKTPVSLGKSRVNNKQYPSRAVNTIKCVFSTSMNHNVPAKEAVNTTTWTSTGGHRLLKKMSPLAEAMTTGFGQIRGQ